MITVSVLLAGVVPGARADTERTVSAAIGYRCGFPSGKLPVEVRITAALPVSGRAGEGITAGAAAAVTFPEAARAELAALKAVSVSGTARLTVAVAQGAHRAEAVWAGSSTEPVSIPAAAEPEPAPGSGSATGAGSGSGSATGAASGAGSDSGSATDTAPGTASPSGPGGGPGAADPVLTFEGPLPTITPGGAGDLTLTAGALALDLALFTADGAPAQPSPHTLDCSPRSGENTGLATIAIPGDDGSAPSSSSPTPSVPGRDPTAAAPGQRGPDGGALTILPPAGQRARPAPPCVGDTENAFAMVAYVTGYSNVAKLDGASEVPLSCTQLIDVSKKIVLQPDGLHLLQHATGELDYRGRPVMPPARATFLTYGFMPTTATMELTQLDTMTIDSDLLLAKYTGLTVVRVPLRLRLYDVEINGVPLDVGPDCRTVGPLYSKDPDPAQEGERHAVLTGELKGPGDGYQLVTGGVLTATVTIPPFSGCGVDEDLDPLFTSSVSGPGNYLKQVQGAPCASGNPRPDPTYCTKDHQPVKVPKPER
ncbi:DUF6801 domain-containing protein [Streptomyces katsurahamanus]|uniref:DUF6801 domain-containing protein n=1 Tax=Streptomyces katsurahamanus TaxID=2577098 RepID=UPI001E52CD6A|nr:DUF6801 domain-containing protein [Streptomyces katsurahamanus]